MKLLVATIMFFLTTVSAFAQEVQPEGFFRQDGKIFVVVSVLTIIFVGIILYLIKLDRKITKLEKENK